MKRFCLACAALIITLVTTRETLLARKNSSALYREAAKIALSGKIDESIPKFKEALAINPYYSMGHYGLGKAYLHREGKMEDAIRSLEKAVKLDNKNAKGHFYLGLGYLMSKKYVMAVHAFDNAYRHDNSIIEALYNIGVAYDIMGYEGKAGKFYDLFLLKKHKVDMDVLF
jgi:tetratricopeptide (TPR) repeat protein